ncbi:MAG: hypothetical protein AAF684_04085 [Pseudomonadota bacterium]
MPQLEPFVTVAQTARQTQQAVNRQPQPTVRSVQEASAPIMQDIVRPVGRTVGVLSQPERLTAGAFEGAGLFGGVSVTV